MNQRMVKNWILVVAIFDSRLYRTICFRFQKKTQIDRFAIELKWLRYPNVSLRNLSNTTSVVRVGMKSVNNHIIISYVFLLVSVYT